MLINPMTQPLPTNERIQMLDRALTLVGLFSPVHELSRKLLKEELAAYGAALKYIAKEYGRGWRAEEDVTPVKILPIALYPQNAPDIIKDLPPEEQANVTRVE